MQLSLWKACENKDRNFSLTVQFLSVISSRYFGKRGYTKGKNIIKPKQNHKQTGKNVCDSRMHPSISFLQPKIFVHMSFQKWDVDSVYYCINKYICLKRDKTWCCRTTPRETGLCPGCFSCLTSLLQKGRGKSSGTLLGTECFSYKLTIHHLFWSGLWHKVGDHTGALCSCRRMFKSIKKSVFVKETNLQAFWLYRVEILCL